MAHQKQTRQQDDTRIAIAATLKRPDNTVVDLSGLTVKFHMVFRKTGEDKVAETSTNVSVTDATNGKVQYSPQAADVDTVGIFHAYFIVEESGKQDTFPANSGEFEISIEPASR